MPSLADLRQEKGWSPEELARIASLDVQVIERIEEGSAQRVSYTHMARLTRALGVDPTSVTEFRPSLGLTAVGQTGAGEDAESGARSHDGERARRRHHAAFR